LIASSDFFPNATPTRQLQVVDVHASMAVLSFGLGPEAVGKLYDALVCLGRFNESVCIEATKDHVRLLKKPHIDPMLMRA
jgi:hypothetical protein